MSYQGVNGMVANLIKSEPADDERAECADTATRKATGNYGQLGRANAQ